MARTQTAQYAIDELSTGRSLRCTEMITLLRNLGFDVRDGRKPGHKVITHPELERFTSASFTCGHGRNAQVKPVYIRDIRKLLQKHAEELNATYEIENGTGEEDRP